MRVEFYAGLTNHTWTLFEEHVDIDPNEGNEALEQIGFIAAQRRFGEVAFVGVYCFHDEEIDEIEFAEE